jgi:hypothetical protein
VVGTKLISGSNSGVSRDGELKKKEKNGNRRREGTH